MIKKISDNFMLIYAVFSGIAFPMLLLSEGASYTAAIGTFLICVCLFFTAMGEREYKKRLQMEMDRHLESWLYISMLEKQNRALGGDLSPEISEEG
jgi:hypothetical protein